MFNLNLQIFQQYTNAAIIKSIYAATSCPFPSPPLPSPLFCFPALQSLQKSQFCAVCKKIIICASSENSRIIFSLIHVFVLQTTHSVLRSLPQHQSSKVWIKMFKFSLLQQLTFFTVVTKKIVVCMILNGLNFVTLSSANLAYFSLLVWINSQS